MAVSTELLDRSKEAFDLKEAVWAGFIKSRFWWIAYRVKPHAIASAVIFFASLIFAGKFFQERPLNYTTFYAFCAILGPLSIWYLVHQNAGFLGRVWKSFWGKLAYGLLASVSLTAGKVMADQQIRLLTQSDPSLFPSAQQAITMLIIMAMICVGLVVLLLLIPVAQYCRDWFWFTKEMLLLPFFVVLRLRELLGIPSQYRTFRESASLLTRSFAGVWGAAFICIIVFPFFSVGFAGFGGKQFNPAEVFLLWSSFIPNDPGLAGSGRACINLPSDTLLSPLSTKDPIASRVVVAQPISTEPDGLGRSFTYHVLACSKPTDTGNFFWNRPR